MKGNYDTIARYYDRLSRLVFGKAQVNAQLSLLDAIPPGANVLIAGGGSGWILEAIAALHPAGLTITYIDASAKMISLARKRSAGDNTVTFIAAGIETCTANEQYDIVITPFLFDNFLPATAQKIFSLIDVQLAPQGAWLYCDFRNTRVFWQRALLKIMYVFFRLCCGIEATRLPDMAACFADGGYNATRQHLFMNGFIVAAVYRKN